MARVVVPKLPHHVTQRGNRRQRTFFREDDYRLYKGFLTRECRRFDVEIWCYCLMSNHVHLILSPANASGLARAVGETHRRYTTMVNRREGWTGYLWQGRFDSFPMNEKHLYNAVRYVLQNPVRAGLADAPIDWPHSSARAHLCGSSDGVVDPKPLARRIEDWSALFTELLVEAECDVFRKSQRTGRPLGDDDFVRSLEGSTGRRLRPKRSGRRLDPP